MAVVVVTEEVVVGVLLAVAVGVGMMVVGMVIGNSFQG